MNVRSCAAASLALVIAATTASPASPLAPGVFIHHAQLLGHLDSPPTGGEIGIAFGHSVSVSGDTIVVGAYQENTPGDWGAGSADVYVRSGATWIHEQKLLASDGALLNRFGYSVSISGDTIVVGAPAAVVGGGALGAAYVFVRSGAVWTQQQKLVASAGTPSDTFGISVAVSGETAVVGAPGDPTVGISGGAAYVFLRSATTWNEQQHIFASDGSEADFFGQAVAISGDTAVIGAAGDDQSGGVDSGSAYVFVRSGTAWSEQQKLPASDAKPYAVFGSAVAVNGDTLAVGAPNDGFPGPALGAAYVFVRSGTSWSEQQKLLSADADAGDLFGSSVSVSGETLVAGAASDDTAGGFNAGSAYAFVRSGATWSEQQKLTASDGVGQAKLGTSVSLDGDTIVAGAPDGFTIGSSAYAFGRSGTTWTEQTKLLASDLTSNDRFGLAVAMSADTIVVGAPSDNTPAGRDAGAAYVFVRSGAGWVEQQKLFASDGARGDEFGSSVSISGDTLVVGARADDMPAGINSGSSYVFVRSGTTWTEQQKLVPADGAEFEYFGESVSVGGDTVVVGTPLQTFASVGSGWAYVFVRSGTTWSQQQKLIPSDGGTSDRFGESMSLSGDTAVIGAPLDDGAASSDAGSAYVFVRSGTTWSEQQKLQGGQSFEGGFGSSVSISGETVAVGAPSEVVPPAGKIGAAYVFVRSGTTWTAQQMLTASDGGVEDFFAASVSLFGETLIVGAFSDDTVAGPTAGSAYVFVRSGTTWTEQQKLLAPGGAPDDSFGIAVALFGDTAVVAASEDDTPGGVEAGSAHVFGPPQADLGVSKTDGQATVVPGEPLSYTIVVSNAGPSDVPGATVTDALPAALLGATWTCVASPGSSCTASGTGNISDLVNVVAGETATYVVIGTVDPAATGTLSNTVTVTPPAAVPDANPSNNSATDIDTLAPETDLTITKTDSADPSIPAIR